MKNLYWEYAGTRYRKKFQAIQAAGRDYLKITCNAFDDSFLSFDFSAEPSKTLHELIDIRCFQIRDKFPYIKLWFSGGSDSTTVLNGFLRNNIHIDEIIIYFQSLNNNFTHTGNYELNHFTFPYLKELSKSLNKTKFTPYWVGYDEYKKFLNDKWFENKNDFDIRTMFAPRMRGNNFCNLYGDFDPFIKKVGNRYFDIQYDTNNINNYNHKNIELFFTSSDLPELHSKQCHLVKKYLKSTEDKRNIKHIVRSIVRDDPVVQEHHNLVKITTPDKYHLWSKKSGAMMREDPNSELLDIYQSILNTTIHNTPVFNLNIGYKVFEIDLGE